MRCLHGHPPPLYVLKRMIWYPFRYWALWTHFGYGYANLALHSNAYGSSFLGLVVRRDDSAVPGSVILFYVDSPPLEVKFDHYHVIGVEGFRSRLLDYLETFPQHVFQGDRYWRLLHQ